MSRLANKVDLQLDAIYTHLQNFVKNDFDAFDIHAGPFDTWDEAFEGAELFELIDEPLPTDWDND